MAVNNILKEQAGNAVLAVLLQFEPQIGVLRKIGAAAEVISKDTKSAQWIANQNNIVVKNAENGYFIVVSPTMIYFQSLGIDYWLENFDQIHDAMIHGLQKLDVTKASQINFNISTHLNLGMRHAELVNLLFGDYMGDRNLIESDVGPVNDMFFKFYSREKSINLQTFVLPQTASQASTTFLGTHNLDLFLNSKYQDPCIKNHLEKVSHDCLTLIFESSLDSVSSASVKANLNIAWVTIQSTADRIVRRVRGFNTSEGDE